MSLKVEPSKFRKVRGSAALESRSDEDQRLEMIVKVNEAGYVPGGVRLRARIDDTLFTCEAPADRLQELEADPRIESVSVSRPLGIVE